MRDDDTNQTVSRKTRGADHEPPLFSGTMTRVFELEFLTSPGHDGPDAISDSAGFCGEVAGGRITYGQIIPTQTTIAADELILFGELFPSRIDINDNPTLIDDGDVRRKRIERRT